MSPLGVIPLLRLKTFSPKSWIRCQSVCKRCLQVPYKKLFLSTVYKVEMARPWAIVLHIYVMLVCIEGCQLICTLNRIFYSRMTSENAKPVNFRNSTRIAQWRSCRCAVLWRSSITCRFVQSTTSERLSQISRRNAELLKCRMHSPRTAPSSGTLHVHSTCIIRRPTSDNFSPSQLTLQRHHNHNLRTTFLTNIM